MFFHTSSVNKMVIQTGKGGGGVTLLLEGGLEVTLLFSTFVSLPTPPTSVTPHSNGQEPRVACAN